MLQTPESVFRRYNTDGVPDSGPHDPNKDEIIQLLNMLFGTSRGGWVVARTLAELNGITPEAETDGGVVLSGVGAGYYDRNASAWVFGRGFPDTFAKVTLTGSGTAQAGAIAAGVNPASIEVFFAKVVTPNTGAMTLSIGGGPVRPVVNLAGNPLTAGEWTGMVIFYLNDAGQYQLLIDAGAAESAAASAAQAQEERIASEAARDAAEGAAETVVVARFNSRAGVEAATINAAVQSIELTGFAAAGDGGGMEIYARIGTEPAHEGKIQSLDGAWWELRTNTPSIGAFGVLEGNTEAENATALANAETFSREVVDLGRDINVPAETYPQKLIQGNGTIYKGGEPFPFNVPGQHARGSIQFGRVGDLKSIVHAIKKGSARVAFWGDSIAEGVSEIDYDDSWAGLLEDHLRRLAPEVDWVFGNFSIPGREVGSANSNTFVGAPNPSSVTPGVNFWAVDGRDRVPPNPSIWPGGTTPGLTWKGHLENFGPDIVIIAFGMNIASDGPTTTLDNMTVMSYLPATAQAWQSNPSVAVVATMLPSREVDSGAPRWGAIQAIADSTRSMASDPSIGVDVTLIDANALYRSLIDGVDVTTTRKRVLPGFADFSDWTTFQGSRPPVTADVLTFLGDGWVNRQIISSDGDWSFEVELGGASSIVDLSYRANPDSPGASYLARVGNFAGVPYLFWYYGTTGLLSGQLDESPTYKVRVRVRGAHHEIWVNNEKLVDAVDYHWVEPGIQGFAGYGPSSVSGFVARLGYPAVIGHPIFTEKHLLGTNDFITDPWSLGGNALNHPSILGHRAVYFQACRPLLMAIGASLGSGAPQVAELRVGRQDIDMTAVSYIRASIMEISGPVTTTPEVTLVRGTVENGRGAEASVVKVVQNASACTVTFNAQETIQITETLDFPHRGDWLVTVHCSASTKTGIGHRAWLVASAIEVK